MIKVEKTGTKETKGNVSGLNVSSVAHEQIEEAKRLLDANSAEIPNYKNNKKDLFAFGAYLVNRAVKIALGIPVEDSDIVQEEEEKDNCK